MAAPVELEVGGRTVRISSPDRVYFPARGETKLDLARYYLSVADGVVRALRGRPCMLHRFPTGVTGEKVHQKRLPRGAPDWVPTVRYRQVVARQVQLGLAAGGEVDPVRVADADRAATDLQLDRRRHQCRTSYLRQSLRRLTVPYTTSPIRPSPIGIIQKSCRCVW